MKRGRKDACVVCRRYHKACDGERPCGRCKSLGFDSVCTGETPPNFAKPTRWKNLQSTSFNSGPPLSQRPRIVIADEDETTSRASTSQDTTYRKYEAQFTNQPHQSGVRPQISFSLSPTESEVLITALMEELEYLQNMNQNIKKEQQELRAEVAWLKEKNETEHETPPNQSIITTPDLREHSFMGSVYMPFVVDDSRKPFLIARAVSMVPPEAPCNFYVVTANNPSRVLFDLPRIEGTPVRALMPPTESNTAQLYPVRKRYSQAYLGQVSPIHQMEMYMVSRSGREFYAKVRLQVFFIDGIPNFSVYCLDKLWSSLPLVEDNKRDDMIVEMISEENMQP